MHATILAYMFTLVELGRILVPLGPVPDNRVYVQEFVARLLKAAFTHLSDNQIKITVQGLFNLDQNIPAFKEHLRDFLVEIRVSSQNPMTGNKIISSKKNIDFVLRTYIFEICRA